MKKPLQYENPEPVPPVSQLLALPFVSAVAGYLVNTAGCGNVRVTLHRLLTRDGLSYLQQICSYAGDGFDHAKAGRLFIADEGIIGAAFADKVIVRTRRYDNEADWWRDYREDRKQVNDQRPELEHPVSFLALPFLDAAGTAVACILFAEVGGLNGFAGGSSLDVVLGMSRGYIELLDNLASRPLPRVRNYPLPIGRPVGGFSTVYPRLQESVKDREPPRLAHLTSFNFAPAP
ncbi:MAG: hypothetical protein EOS50_01575 [Mesorhizobium sp.]|nr:MAG: hypothetical protein EOS50_01575 [Mesorhizobium sp.]